MMSYLGGRQGGREGEKERGGGGRDMDEERRRKVKKYMYSICTCRPFCNGNDYAIFAITIQYAKSDIYMYMKHNTCTVGIN